MSDFKSSEFEKEFDERVIEIARVAKVVKGGRRIVRVTDLVFGHQFELVGIGLEHIHRAAFGR